MQNAAAAAALQVFFERHVPLDKLVKRVSQLSSVRELLDSRDAEGIVLGYGGVVELNPAVTPEIVEKMLSRRYGLRMGHAACTFTTCMLWWCGVLHAHGC